MLEEIRNLADALAGFASIQDAGEVQRLSHMLIERAQVMRDDAYAAGLRDSKTAKVIYGTLQQNNRRRQKRGPIVSQ